MIIYLLRLGNSSAVYFNLIVFIFSNETQLGLNTPHQCDQIGRKFETTFRIEFRLFLTVFKFKKNWNWLHENTGKKQHRKQGLPRPLSAKRSMMIGQNWHFILTAVRSHCSSRHREFRCVCLTFVTPSSHVFQRDPDVR
jgi:hypothetical protein